MILKDASANSFLRRALASRSFVSGLVITLIIVTMAFVSFFWTPYDVTTVALGNRMLSPSLSGHLLGTDRFGRDILSMIMAGARNSIALALAAVIIGMGIGVPLGCLAAARGGFVDEIVMRFNDLVFAFPALVTAIMLSAIYGPGVINAIIAIGIFNIPVLARVARAGALAVWPKEFILAARASGRSTFQITIEHILPNIASLLLVQATVQLAIGILAEVGLSYLGLGPQPPTPCWGRMLLEAQPLIAVMPTLALFPGLAVIFTVLGLNLLGDGVSEALDPKLRQRQ